MKKQSIESVSDVQDFVTNLYMPFGDQKEYKKIMMIDLTLTLLSFLTSFVYLRDTVKDIKDADVELDLKRQIYQ